MKKPAEVEVIFEEASGDPEYQYAEASAHPECPEDLDAAASAYPVVPEDQDAEASYHPEASVSGAIDDGNTHKTPEYVRTMGMTDDSPRHLPFLLAISFE